MLIISACLAGINCRYNGRNCLKPSLAELYNSGKAIAVCPEVLGGLPIPREASEIRNIDNEIHIIGRDGCDYTQAFRLGAEKVLNICLKHTIKTAILKTKSPSCSFGLIYDGSFSGKLVKGNGICSDLLVKNSISVYTEETWQEIPPEMMQ